MRKGVGIALSLLSALTFAGNNFSIKDNSNIALTMSQMNYNRIVVRGDRITEAVFPPNSMAIKRDEQDGSVYVMLASSSPFTLFLTTEAGHHFSVTLSGEDGLGKTIELIPEQRSVSKVLVNQGTHHTASNKDIVPEAILAMLSHMEAHQPFSDVAVKRQFGKAERWSKGLVLLPKEEWNGKELKGEIIELYNGGKETFELSQEWFAKESTLAIKFSKTAILPHEKVTLYRVQRVSHG